MLFFVFACTTAPSKNGANRSQDSARTIVDTADALTDTATSDVVVEPSVCPEEMVLINEKFCIDRYEASVENPVNGTWEPHSPYHTPSGNSFRSVSKPYVTPQAHISGEMAQVACENSGKRLCTSEEWLLSCRGTEERIFPYGSTYQSNACNDVYADGHPLIHYFGTSEGIWDAQHMNDPNINQQPNSLAKTGAFDNCVTPEGVYDLHGNIHEWVADDSGTFRGGFYADASINGTGCQYRTTAHNKAYYDYSTGFRCCADKSR